MLLTMWNKEDIIPIACDHGGFEMKEFIRENLEKEGYKIKDMGTYSTESVDYPEFIHPISKAINNAEYKQGIILCGSGNGAQMTANKYPNVRAGLCWTNEQAMLTRQHNNANILALPGRFVNNDLALEMVHTYLNTAFEGGRHQTRVEKINKI